MRYDSSESAEVMMDQVPGIQPEHHMTELSHHTRDDYRLPRIMTSTSSFFARFVKLPDPYVAWIVFKHEATQFELSFAEFLDLVRFKPKIIYDYPSACLKKAQGIQKVF